MKKNFLTNVAFALALGLVACGDDGSSSGPSEDGNAAEESSSSVIPSTGSGQALSGGSAEVEGSSSSSKANWAYLNPDIDYGEFTDERDGQVYKTVKIGTQTWMAENLNYDPGDVSSMSSYAWSGCYNNKADSCVKYGRLYTWEVAMNDASCAFFHSCHPSGTVQGVCPSGWHLPSDTEWNTLWAAVGGTSTAGRKLMSTSGWNDGGNGTDSFGFAVLPAGGRHDRSFYYEGDYANFWSSTENNSRFADNWYFRYDLDDVRNYWNFKYYAFSVRCLQD